MTTSIGRARGFTLVEIMIVVAIVGLLSAIAVPSFLHVKRKTQDTLVMNALRQLYDAKELYFFDEGSGKTGASFSTLEKAGYLSQSLVATCAHDIGAWHTTNLRGMILHPNKPIQLTESFKNGNRVNFGRALQYPAEP
jgi:prepilin-type N-terminal cleavage/methylation domain-containing protein